VAPAHQIDVDVVVVIDVRTRRRHRGEFTASGGLYVAQKPLLFRQAMPAVLHRDLASVGEREGGDVERVAEGVLGDAGARIAVHAATGISGNLPDLGNRRTEPAHRRRLHPAANPPFQFRNHRPSAPPPAPGGVPQPGTVSARTRARALTARPARAQGRAGTRPPARLAERGGYRLSRYATQAHRRADGGRKARAERLRPEEEMVAADIRPPGQQAG